MNINTLVDSDLKKKADASHELRDTADVFHVSGLGLCLKGAYYQRLGAKEPYSPEKLRIFELGHTLEERVGNVFKEAGVLVEEQFRIMYPEYELRGTCDFIVKLAEDQPHKLVEMKTMNSNGFRVMMEKQERAKSHHAIQVCLYWNKLKEKYPDIRPSVLYVNKDTFGMYEVELTDSEIEAALGQGITRAEALKKAWDAKVPPEVDEESWVSRYCGVHTYCAGTQVIEQAKS